MPAEVKPRMRRRSIVIAPPGMTETAQRGGHIPGAKSIPWAKTANEDGTFKPLPEIERIFADGGYQGPKMAKTVAATGCWKMEIVKRSDLHRFVVLPKRWIVERTFAWISRNRRLMRDFERHTRTVAAFVRLAMIRLMLRRLAATP